MKRILVGSLKSDAWLGSMPFTVSVFHISHKLHQSYIMLLNVILVRISIPSHKILSSLSSESSMIQSSTGSQASGSFKVACCPLLMRYWVSSSTFAFSSLSRSLLLAPSHSDVFFKADKTWLLRARCAISSPSSLNGGFLAIQLGVCAATALRPWTPFDCYRTWMNVNISLALHRSSPFALWVFIRFCHLESTLGVEVAEEVARRMKQRKR